VLANKSNGCICGTHLCHRPHVDLLPVELAQAAHEILRHVADVNAGRCEVIQAERAHNDLPHAAPLVLHESDKRFCTEKFVEVGVDYGYWLAVAATVECNLHVFRPCYANALYVHEIESAEPV
jgi:hypothetical protein